MARRILIKLITFLKTRLLGIDPRSPLQIAIANGMKLGNNCQIMENVVFDQSHCWLIEIKDKVIIAPQCYILAHDTSTKRHLGYTVIGRVTIMENTFLGARTIVLPGVTIGRNCIIGAGSVVSKSIPDNSIAVGCPAKVVGSITDYLTKRKGQMGIRPTYGGDYKIGAITNEQKLQMIKDLEDGIGFIV